MGNMSENMQQAALARAGYALYHKRIGEIYGDFFIPRYQRGYRWADTDVTRLLDDVWASLDKEYNLQPVVVKLYKKGADEKSNEWELIDGQQRLTTLFLILRYMQLQGWKRYGAPYSLRYQTRPGSEQYLSTLDPSKRNANIDYHHLYQAYETIGDWFKKHGDEIEQDHVATKLHVHLFDNVRIIWYQAPPAVDPALNERDSIALFTRLNVGRIALTDAELIKALLLSTILKWQAERAQEVAAQWDGIERDLQDPDIWAFVAGDKVEKTSEHYATRISLLLDSLADEQKPVPGGGKRPRYHTFEALRGQIDQSREGALEFWKRVIELHARIVGWFGVPVLYNKIGFLIAAGTPLGDLAKLAKEKKKSEFDVELTTRIGEVVRIKEDQLLGLSYDDKKHGYPKLLQLLLLMNVETASRAGQRFPFRRHQGKAWSLEHIHAQNAQSLTKVEQWKAWLHAHKVALAALPAQDSTTKSLQAEIETALQTIDTAINFGPVFERLSAQVIAVFEAPGQDGAALGHGMHAISNLALLSRNDNSALSNAVFEVKRRMILEIDRNLEGSTDTYIPICTRNVFLKYYPGADARQLHFWGLQDRESYYTAIVSTVGKYFVPKVS
jgi:hypothetical protein